MSLRPSVGHACTTSALTLRSEAAGKKLATIPNRERVEVIVRGEWYQVRFSGRVGYSHSDPLVEDNPHSVEHIDIDPMVVTPTDVTEDPVAQVEDKGSAKEATAKKTDFKLQKCSRSNNKVKVYKGDNKHATLHKANLYPTPWFSLDSTKVQSVGRRVSAPIHVSLAQHAQERGGNVCDPVRSR